MVRKYGSWLQALEQGYLTPLTESQKEFKDEIYHGKLDPLYNTQVASQYN
jgi:hypothetical protein